MSYDRMGKEEARLKAEGEQLIAQAEAVDAAEDKLYGVGQQPKDLPAELQRREGRRERIRELRAALEKKPPRRGRSSTSIRPTRSVTPLRSPRGSLDRPRS
jgi:hypothetical protein